MPFFRRLIRILLLPLGIVVKETNQQRSDENARVLVTNYTSIFDHIAIGLCFPNTTVKNKLKSFQFFYVVYLVIFYIQPDVWSLPPMLVSLFAYTNMGVEEGKETLIANVKRHCAGLLGPQNRNKSRGPFYFF